MCQRLNTGENNNFYFGIFIFGPLTNKVFSFRIQDYRSLFFLFSSKMPQVFRIPENWPSL